VSRKTLILLATRVMVLLLFTNLAQGIASILGFLKNGYINSEAIQMYAKIANVNIEVELAAICSLLVLPPLLLTTLPGDEAVEKELDASDLLIVIVRTIGIIASAYGFSNTLPPYLGINETSSATYGITGVLLGLLAFGFASQITNLLLPPPQEATQ
jgi:hypothetical protein